MDLQIIIALSSYILIALREGLVVVIKPIKEETVQPMRWLFLILTILWLLVAMALPVVAFVLTKNLLSFALFDTFAPPIYILSVSWESVSRRSPSQHKQSRTRA
jgi:hypothetical protein